MLRVGTHAPDAPGVARVAKDYRRVAYSGVLLWEDLPIDDVPSDVVGD